MGKKKAMTNGRSTSSDSDDEVYEVESILACRLSQSGTLEHLIKWKGYDAKWNTWEPLDCLSCPEKLESFHSAISSQVQFFFGILLILLLLMSSLLFVLL
jgi:hypothetical protein